MRVVPLSLRIALRQIQKKTPAPNSLSMTFNILILVRIVCKLIRHYYMVLFSTRGTGINIQLITVSEVGLELFGALKS